MPEDIIVRVGKTIRFDYFIFLIFKKHYNSYKNIVQEGGVGHQNPAGRESRFNKVPTQSRIFSY